MKSRDGFTLLEVLLVILLLGMLTAMFLPKGLEIDNAARSRRTRQALDEIVRAITGPTPRFDKDGNPVFAGFTADMARLPRLFLGTWKWDDQIKDWTYFDPATIPNDDRFTKLSTGAGYANSTTLSSPVSSPEDFRMLISRLQPIELWDNDARLELSADAWHGPYMSRPKDEFPRNADSFGYTRPQDYAGASPVDQSDYWMLQTESRLADGWGRSFIFWPRYDRITGQTDLWIISQGPDSACEWAAVALPDSSVVYDYNPQAPKNADNIYCTIKYHEWYDHNILRKIELTHKTMENVRTALLGPAGAHDNEGHGILGGYVADLGMMPDLFVWSENPAPGWQDYSGGLTTEPPQPRALWTNDEANKPLYANGFGWRGPYYNGVWGRTGKDETVIDAWGRPVAFSYVDTPSGMDFVMTSAGPDGIAGNTDDITLAIHASEWQPIYFDQMADQTNRIINDISNAMIGRPASNQVVGGFAGDMGRLPYLYQWGTVAGEYQGWVHRFHWDSGAGNIVGETWTGTMWGAPSQTFDEKLACPCELWTSDPVGNGDSLPPYRHGIGWRGSYLPAPAGTGADQVLKDAWGRRLQFDFEDQGDTRITSTGPDFRDSTDDIARSVSLPVVGTPGTVHFKTTVASGYKPGIYYEPGKKPHVFPYDGSGIGSIELTDVPSGVRTVMLWNDTNANDQPDPGEVIHEAVITVDSSGRPDRGNDPASPIELQ